MSHTDIGHYLLGLGAVLVYVSTALDVATRDARTTRRVGRAVLRVVGPLTRPFRAFHRRLGESPAARCARLDRHVESWDGYHEYCTRCGRTLLDVLTDGPLDPERGVVRAAAHTEWVYLDDPRIVPGPLVAPTTPSGVSSALWHVNERAARHVARAIARSHDVPPLTDRERDLLRLIKRGCDVDVPPRRGSWLEQGDARTNRSIIGRRHRWLD